MLLLLIYYLISVCNAYAHKSASSLGTYMTVSPESTDAPAGDEVQLQCELNLPPEKVEFRFRPLNSTSNERDKLIDIHKMVKRKVYTHIKVNLNESKNQYLFFIR